MVRLKIECFWENLYFLEWFCEILYFWVNFVVLEKFIFCRKCLFGRKICIFEREQLFFLEKKDSGKFCIFGKIWFCILRKKIVFLWKASCFWEIFLFWGKFSIFGPRIWKNKGVRKKLNCTRFGNCDDTSAFSRKASSSGKPEQVLAKRLSWESQGIGFEKKDSLEFVAPNVHIPSF